MKKHLTLGTLSLVASAFLIGCGSSSDSSSTTTDTQTGYFIDSPVVGLDYKTSSGVTGITDNRGGFKYKEGETVEFSIGKLKIGEAEPTQDGLISPRELTDNETSEVLLLRTLQALDSDNNTSNGIVIPDCIRTDLENIDTNVTLSKMTDDIEVLSISSTLAESIDEDYNGVIDVNATEALTHYEKNLKLWDSGERPKEVQTQQGQHGNGSDFNISVYPKSTLNQDLIDSLSYMGNEERLAHDIYTVLYNYHKEDGTEIKQLINISSNSEVKHVGIVQDIVRRYDINATNTTNVVNPVADKNVAFEEMPIGEYDVPKIQELYDSLYAKGITSVQDALEVGCMVEVVDVDDLDIYIKQAEASNAEDIIAGFNILRDGSYNHYWAFDKGLKNMGVTEGCAVLGEEWAKTPEEYPSSNANGGKGNGNGQRNGQGQGNGYGRGRG